MKRFIVVADEKGVSSPECFVFFLLIILLVKCGCTYHRMVSMCMLVIIAVDVGRATEYLAQARDRKVGEHGEIGASPGEPLARRKPTWMINACRQLSCTKHEQVVYFIGTAVRYDMLLVRQIVCGNCLAVI